MATSSRAVDSRLQEAFADEEPQKCWRFDEDVAIGEIKMDDWRKLQTIAGHTHNYLNSFATTTSINNCADALIAAKPDLRIHQIGPFVCITMQVLVSKANWCLWLFILDAGAKIKPTPEPILLALTEEEEDARMGINHHATNFPSIAL